MVKRGGCTFVTKAINAERAGAKLVIIVDDKADEDATQVVMGDDGNGDNVNIPTIFVNQKDGAYLENLAFEMEMEAKRNKSEK